MSAKSRKKETGDRSPTNVLFRPKTNIIISRADIPIIR